MPDDDQTGRLPAGALPADSPVPPAEGRHPGGMVDEEEHGEGERLLKGVGVAPGIAIGPAYKYARDRFDVERRTLSQDEVEREIKRFHRAVRRAERDLQKIATLAREKLGDDSAGIFEAQLLMLRDDVVFDAVIDRVREERCNADYAVQQILEHHGRLLATSGNTFFRERASDLQDVQQRVILHLRRGRLISSIRPGSIVLAESLTAADVLLFSRRDLKGVATDFGGATSHVSIMARSMHLPAVVSLHGGATDVAPGETVILDGLDGHIILNPTAETLRAYEERRDAYERRRHELKALVPLAAETQDGHKVQLSGNLEFEEEVGLLEEYGADGVGLFRTEIHFLMQQRISFSEEEQVATYRRIVEAVSPGVTTFRVLDLGGDKMLPMGHREHNPVLGWRGIRVLLDKPDLLRRQVRALLRASAFGPVRLLVPMVTTLSEIRRFRQLVAEVCEELEGDGHDCDSSVPIGVMVEVPGTALQAKHFAKESDFFSIGTNDLTQYTLAVDRGNDLVAELYDEVHPGVLQLIAQTVKAGDEAGIPVSVCGELAGNAKALPILVGLGVRSVSASPVYLPEVKRILRAVCYEETGALAQQALAASGADEVHALMDAWLEERDLAHAL